MKSEVFNMDCMIGMAQYPDKYFDLAVVDPPYGIGGKTLTTGGTWSVKWKNTALWDVKPTETYFKELFRISKNQIIWGGNYFNELPECRCFLIWDKVAIMHSLADCEFAWTSFDKNAKIFRMVRNASEKRIHITQKPIKLYSWIYKNYLPQGGKVIDTHLGSGSNRIAADKAGNIDFVGYELDKDYFEAQEKRWKNYKAQLVMNFDENKF